MASPITNSSNPFRKKNGKRSKIEKIQYGFFLFATYCILLCALTIFGKIIIEGAPVLWQKGWSFILNKPQTLSVIDTEAAENIQIPTKNFDNIITSNPEELPLQDIKDIQRTFRFVNFKLQPGSVIGEGYLKNLEQKNKGFKLIYTKRDLLTPMGFTLASDKNISLKSADFQTIQNLSPDIIPAEVEDQRRHPHRLSGNY